MPKRRTKKSAPSSPPSKPFILNVPNEVLHDIFSRLYDLSYDQSFVNYRSNGKEYEVSQMLVLRSVCRRFRAITSKLDFWHDADFRFTELIPPRKIYGDHLLPEDLSLFLEALFSDADLVESLSERKTDWVFESLQVLAAVLGSVPKFMENVRAIHLELLEPEYFMHPSRLSVAIGEISIGRPKLIELSTRLSNFVELDEIATAFPTLKSLTIAEAGEIFGSLQQLGQLRKLYISAWEEIGPDRPWLPLGSVATLTQLTLECGPEVDMPLFFDIDSLRAFVNLKSLGLRPLTEALCDFLIGSQIQLHTFEIRLNQQHVRIPRFIDLLHAKCLHNLKELDISSFRDGRRSHNATSQYWRLAFDAFTCLLPSVEEVQLDAPLHRKWCPYFARMPNLKILNWDGSGNPTFGFGRGGGVKARMEEKLNATFANRLEKPEFAVHFIGY
jgi:F-box domain